MDAIFSAAKAVVIAAGSFGINPLVNAAIIEQIKDGQRQQQREGAKQILRSQEEQLQHATTENEGHKTAHRHKTNRLKNELMREKQAKEMAFSQCRRLEKDNVRLKNQAQTDKRELERLKEQISSTSNNKSSYDMSRDPRGVCVIINNIHFEDMAERDGAEGDVSRYFHYIKENVTTEWKDLATILGLSWADITNIDRRNWDDKSRCWDALQEWRKGAGEGATIAVLIEALRELELTSVVDGLRSKYPGSKFKLSAQRSGRPSKGSNFEVTLKSKVKVTWS